jgi:hypothetical protein
MKKFLFLVSTILILGCTSNSVVNDCFPFITVNESVNLDLPQFIDLQVPGGWAYTGGGLQGLIIYNSGLQFKAFDRSCPGQNISSCSQMIVFANEYLVENLNGSLLRITNF